MIENKNCWLKDNCNKCDCNGFCMRLYKLDFLYEQALISLMQRRHLTLRIDNNGTDEEKFSELKNIENNIEEFVSKGDNLYIHSSIAGNGKTSWALRMVEAYFNKIWHKTSLSCKALFINVPSFLLALKDNITTKSEYIKHIKEKYIKSRYSYLGRYCY